MVTKIAKKEKIFYPMKTIENAPKETISYDTISRESENSDFIKINVSHLALKSSKFNFKLENNITECLKSFYVQETNNTDGRLLAALKNYILGPKDNLKCTLCCFDRIDLSEMRKKNTSDNGYAKRENDKDMRFCNKEVLHEVALHILSFDPFCPEYTKQFYPNCNPSKSEHNLNL